MAALFAEQWPAWVASARGEVAVDSSASWTAAAARWVEVVWGPRLKGELDRLVSTCAEGIPDVQALLAEAAGRSNSTFVGKVDAPGATPSQGGARRFAVLPVVTALVGAALGATVAPAIIPFSRIVGAVLGAVVGGGVGHAVGSRLDERDARAPSAPLKLAPPKAEFEGFCRQVILACSEEFVRLAETELEELRQSARTAEASAIPREEAVRAVTAVSEALEKVRAARLAIS